MWVGESVEQYGAFFDMSRDSHWTVRHCFFIELAGSVSMGVVAGWRPTSEGACVSVASMMLVTSAALLLYEVVFLPLQMRA